MHHSRERAIQTDIVDCDCLAASIHSASENSGAIADACIACPRNPAHHPLQLACGHFICRDHLPLLRDWDLAIAAHLQPEEAAINTSASAGPPTPTVLDPEPLGGSTLSAGPHLGNAEHSLEPPATVQPNVNHIVLGSTGKSPIALILPMRLTIASAILANTTVSVTISSQPQAAAPTAHSVSNLHPFGQFLVENLLDLCEFIPVGSFICVVSNTIPHSDIEQTIAPIVAGMHVTPQLASIVGDNPLDTDDNDPIPGLIVPDPSSPGPLNVTVEDPATFNGNHFNDHGSAMEVDVNESESDNEANEEPDFATPESSVVSWTDSVTREAIEILDRAEAMHRASQS